MPTLDRETLREIIKILKEHKRKDLIDILQDAFDPDYKPPRRIKRDFYSDDSGSAEEEEEYSVSVDSDGLWSIA